MKEMSKSIKLGLCYWGLFIVYILQCNNNNIPEPIIQRIIKPVKVRAGYASLGGLVLVIVLFYILKRINDIENYKFTRTKVRRVVCVILILHVFNNFSNLPVKVYKRFASGLDSIYLDRENTNVQFSSNENDEINLKGEIAISNCGDETQNFYVKVKAGQYDENDSRDEYITLKNEYSVNPKSKEVFDISEDINQAINEYSSYTTKVYEYVLFNDNYNVTFKGDYFFYYVD